MGYVANPGFRNVGIMCYCRGQAKEAIKHCVLLPEDRCFAEVVELLRSRYGRPHQVIRAVTRVLYDGPSISSNDVRALDALLQQMRGCSITLAQLNYMAGLNCSTNLLRIGRHLPKPRRVKFAEVADSMTAIGEEATFEDLVGLIERRVSVGSTEYGELTFQSSTPKAQPTGHRVASVTVDVHSACCPLCSAGHMMSDCPSFKDYSTDK